MAKSLRLTHRQIKLEMSIRKEEVRGCMNQLQLSTLTALFEILSVFDNLFELSTAA